MLTFWIIMGIVVAIIASSKNKNFIAWFLYGILIWPVALVHILVSDKDGSKTCPRCAEKVLEEATVCKHCGSELDESPAKIQ